MAVVLVYFLFASAVSGLSIIPSMNGTNLDSIQDDNNNNSNETGVFHNGFAVPCRPYSNEPEFIPNILACEDYHICVSGQSFDHSCADGLIFSIDRMMCTTTGRCLLDYEPICTASGVLMPHLYDCRHFFYCAPNVVDPILIACMPGHLFDQNSMQCAPENEAICGNPPNDDLEDWPGNIHFE